MPVGRPADVSTRLTQDGTSFLTLQRDGADVVPGRLDRQPSHLLDRTATVYQPPKFTGPDTDELARPLRADRGPRSRSMSRAAGSTPATT